MDAWIGIDVSKDTLDACLLRPSGKFKDRKFDNNPAGFQKLLGWSDSLVGPDRHFCMEATGAYSHAVASFLVDKGELVSVENPARIKYFGMGEGILNKTDKVDARVIAQYAKQKQPEPWRPSRPEVLHLTALMRRLQAVETHLSQERNRLSEPGIDPEVARSINTIIQALEQETNRLEAQVREHIDQHPGLRADKVLLTSIKGVGEKLAHWVLAELPDLSHFKNAKSASAFAGLSPMEYTSGRSVKRRTRISKAGNNNLRRALYMPAIAASRFNPVVADLYKRLLERGKCKMIAICAAMRKLLMLAYGVLKTRKPFDPEFANSKA
jgi:transposase